MILDLFEEVSGARLMCNYMRFGGVAARPAARAGCDRAQVPGLRPPAARRGRDWSAAHAATRSSGARAAASATCPPRTCIALQRERPADPRGAASPTTSARPSPTAIYDRFDFDVPTLPESDIYARFYVRMLEMRQSLQDPAAGAARHSRRARCWAARAATPSARPKAKPTRASRRRRASWASTWSATAAEPLPLPRARPELHQPDRAGPHVPSAQDGRRGRHPGRASTSCWAKWTANVTAGSRRLARRAMYADDWKRLKGLGITLQHLRDTFTDDRKEVPSRYEDSSDLAATSAASCASR